MDVDLAACSDTELLDRARDGAASAFAVLVHRHAPAVRAAVAGDDDPTGATIATFVRAMRRLGQAGPEQVRPWLLELARQESRAAVAVPATTTPPPLDPDEADEIWAELDVRWPDGKVRRSVPGWAPWLALVVALLALAVLVPYLLLRTDAAPAEEPRDHLVAVPYADLVAPDDGGSTPAAP